MHTFGIICIIYHSSVCAVNALVDVDYGRVYVNLAEVYGEIVCPKMGNHFIPRKEMENK